MPPRLQAELTRDFLSAWEAIRFGVVDKNTTTRIKYWNAWKQYCAYFKRSPYLETCTNLQQIIIITGFAARVRTGFYGRRCQVKAQTVADALAAISKTIELAGECSPVYKAKDTYVLPVERLMEGFRREDPPAIPQLAVPISVPEYCCTTGLAAKDPKLQAIGDLPIIAFYYLLRVGEYTQPRYIIVNGKQRRATRTVQFRIGDIGFFKDNAQLPRNSPLPLLLTADQCTLKITNQKNGRMGETINHHAIKDNPLCPVKALARRVHHILSNDGTTKTLLCAVKINTPIQTQSHWYNITSSDMLTNLRSAITALSLHKGGIDPDLVGVHSLRAAGAMALKLAGISDTTIMKMGRWTSLTFLQYIHNQIAHLSKDLSLKMSTKLEFTNIAAIEQ